MTLSVKHPFHSPKADGPDSTLVKPTDWNADHTLLTDQSVPVVVGRVAAGPGPLIDLPISVVFPIGAVIPYAGAAAPTGWLLCFGQSLIQADYPALYAVILQTYGAGPGPSTFLLPDMRGSAAAGKSNMGGADRGNLNAGAVLGQYLGGQSVGGLPVSVTVNVGSWYGGGTFGGGGYTTGTQSVNTTSQGPSGFSTEIIGGQGYNYGYVGGYHTHGISVSTGGENLGVTLSSFGANGGGTGTTTAGFSTVQPTVVLNYIIKY